MAALENILKNFSLYLDGTSYAGKADSVQLPALKTKNEEMRAGGMDVPVDVDMGMEKMELVFTFGGWDATAKKLFGLHASPQKTFEFRGALESLDGTVKAVRVTAQGRISAIEPGEAKPGEKATEKYTVSLVYYKYVEDGQTIHEIDILNFKRLINGTDELAKIRTAIGQ